MNASETEPLPEAPKPSINIPGLIKSVRDDAAFAYAESLAGGIPDLSALTRSVEQLANGVAYRRAQEKK